MKSWGASLVAQTVKNLPARWEMRVWSLGREDPLEKGMATHSGIPAWRIPMDRGVWGATVNEVAKSQTRLSDWHFQEQARVPSVQPAPLCTLEGGTVSPALHSEAWGRRQAVVLQEQCRWRQPQDVSPASDPASLWGPRRPPEAELSLYVATVTSSWGLRGAHSGMKRRKGVTSSGLGAYVWRACWPLTWPSLAGESPAPRPCVLPHSFLPWAVLWPRALTWLCHPGSLLPASPHHLSSLIPEPHSKGFWIQRVPFCQERCERRMKEVASIPLQGWKGVHTEILPA